MDTKALFDTIKAIKGKPLTQADVDAVNAVLSGPVIIPDPASTVFNGQITERVALELISHEAIVREAYKDSVGVWTWSVGITNATGHDVMRYKDNPQTIEKCLEVYLWALDTYATTVREAFAGHYLTESQFCAALSFHYNTGAIKRASWVKMFKDGHLAAAESAFMTWNKPAEILGRRKKERDLLFNGTWSGDGKATVYPVRRPSYAPWWSKAERVDIREALREAMKA